MVLVSPVKSVPLTTMVHVFDVVSKTASTLSTTGITSKYWKAHTVSSQIASSEVFKKTMSSAPCPPAANVVSESILQVISVA